MLVVAREKEERTHHWHKGMPNHQRHIRSKYQLIAINSNMLAYIEARELVETSLSTSTLSSFKRAWSLLSAHSLPYQRKYDKRTAATKGTTAKIKARENRIVIRVVK